MEYTSVFDMTDVVNMGCDVIVEETTEPTEVSVKPAAEAEGAKKNHITTVLIITNIVTISVAAIALYFLISKKHF